MSENDSGPEKGNDAIRQPYRSISDSVDDPHRSMILNEELPRYPEVRVDVDEAAAETARQLRDQSPRPELWEWLNDVMQPQFVFVLPDGTEVRPGE